MTCIYLLQCLEHLSLMMQKHLPLVRRDIDIIAANTSKVDPRLYTISVVMCKVHTIAEAESTLYGGAGYLCLGSAFPAHGRACCI